MPPVPIKERQAAGPPGHHTMSGPAVRARWVTTGLYPDQTAAVEWVRQNDADGHGSVLGHAAGEGKTLMSLFITCMRWEAMPAGARFPTLIIVPFSAISTWTLNLANHTTLEEDVDYIVVRGQRNSRYNRSGPVIGLFGPELKIIITTPEMLRTNNNIAVFNAGFRDRPPKYYVIVDEAHRMRDAHNLLSKKIKTLNYVNALMLTATVCNNHYSDILVLMDLCGMTPLENKTMRKIVTIWASSDLMCLSRAESILDQRANAIIQRYMLRAAETKCTFETVYEQRVIDFATDEERRLYRRLEEELGRAQSDGGPTKLRCIDRMRQFVLSPGSIDTVPPASPHLVSNGSKMLAAVQMAVDITSGAAPHSTRRSRLIFFVNYVKFIPILAAQLRARGIALRILTGDTCRDDRVEIMDHMNRPAGAPGAQVLISSFQVSGTSISLVGCNHAIMMDSLWTPNVVGQAVSRMARPGQVLPVYVYCLLVNGTLDMSILKHYWGDKIEMSTHLERIMSRAQVILSP